VQGARDKLAIEVEGKLARDVVPGNRLVQLIAMGLEYEEIIKNGGVKRSKHDMQQ
jgi:hypothetical protein